MKIAYHETTLGQVLNFFAKEFTPPTGTKIVKFEVFTSPIPETCDQRVLFRLYVEDGENHKIATLDEPK